MPSLHRRIARTVLAFTAPVVVVLSLAMDMLASGLAWRQFDAALVGRARDLSTLLEREPERYEFEYDERYVPDYASGRAGYFEIRRERDADVIARSTTLEGGALPPSVFAAKDATLADVTLPDGASGRAVTLRFVPRLDEDIPAGDGARYQDGVVLVVAVPITEVAAELGALRLWLWSLCVLAVAVAAAASVLAARSGLRPLDRVAKEIATVDDRQLGQRLVLANVPAELRGPLDQVNALLGRLEESFVRERRFASDASHELRTPLAALRAVLQLALARPRESQEYKDAITRALAMVEQLGSIVERLLMLARADAGQVRGKLVEIALRPLVEERWFGLRDAAAQHELRFEVALDDDDSIVTEEATLVVVVGNLLDNAVAYTRRGGTIRVHRPHGTVLEVWDSGPVPDETTRERMFERFWREDAARSGAGVHVGLGLPLSRAMARAVGLDVLAVAVDDGLGVRLVVREQAGRAPAAGEG